MRKILYFDSRYLNPLQHNYPQPMNLEQLRFLVRPFDIIKVIGPFYFHYAVVLEDGMVFHTNVEIGFPHVTTLKKCLNGRLAYIERSAENHYMEMLARLYEVRANPRLYRLLLDNCEHVARYIVTGKYESHQVGGWYVLCGIAGLALLIRKTA